MLWMKTARSGRYLVALAIAGLFVDDRMFLPRSL
jgi:hypothetical protein